MELPGLIVAPLTSFTADLSVDEPALKRQIDYVVRDCRATMVVAAGVETQEYTYLGFEARKALIRRTIEFVDKRAPVMVGISHASFKTAMNLIGVPVGDPYPPYVSPTPEEISSLAAVLRTTVLAHRMSAT